MSGVKGLVTQSNFLPWRGFFAMLRKVDIYVTYDSQQYTRRSWRNRNLILVNGKATWLTLPIKSKGNSREAINQIELEEGSLVKARHILEGVYMHYKKQNGFTFVMDLLEQHKDTQNLSDLNRALTTEIMKYLEIECRIVNEEKEPIGTEKNEKLIEVCKHFHISDYFSGPFGDGYLNVESFSQSGINVTIFDLNNLSKPKAEPEFSIVHHLITTNSDSLREWTTFIDD
jgi:hypothetical protein